MLINTGQSFEARMGTPTKQNINSTWLFDEVTEEFGRDTLPSDNELLLMPSSPLVQPVRVETACDALLLTVSTQEEESFLQSMFECVSCRFPELFTGASAAMNARCQQQVARTPTNELGPARDNCGHGHLSLINNIKVIYSTSPFLIVHMEVRYSPNHYLLLITPSGEQTI